MENKDINIEEYLESIVNNTYLTEIVEEYSNNKSAEDFKPLCEVLSYRDLYLGMVLLILDKKVIKKLKKENEVDIESLNDDICIKEYLKCEGECGEENKIFLAVFTEPSKVLLNEGNANTIVNTNFSKMMEEILCNENCDGIIINPFEEGIIIENHYLQLLYKKEFDTLYKISRMFEITNRLKEIDEEEVSDEFNILMDEFCVLLEEFKK